ncbi:hypothetical protein LIER_34614 [Lithospermum erythrorhizon]|uniref:Uncharacterized protein n=1 Tax=Lithospermum erythrorhizon TaxID=34254 RepID=A0AAV3S001_LITER
MVCDVVGDILKRFFLGNLNVGRCGGYVTSLIPRPPPLMFDSSGVGWILALLEIQMKILFPPPLTWWRKKSDGRWFVEMPVYSVSNSRELWEHLTQMGTTSILPWGCLGGL